jgi:hypothetical protein
MQTKDARVKAVERYSEIMREIKFRLSAIGSAMNGETKLQRMLAQEFCFLQLRMVCELVALACLCAHGDLSEASRLKTEWSPETILGKLETLQKHFFPWPSRQLPGTGKIKFRIWDDDQRPDCITKDELLKLYGLCGNYVHRGKFRDIFDIRRARIVSFETIQGYCQKIINLLGNHSVLIKRGDKVYLLYCSLNTEPDGAVQVFAAAEVEPPP